MINFIPTSTKNFKGLERLLSKPFFVSGPLSDVRQIEVISRSASAVCLVCLFLKVVAANVPPWKGDRARGSHL